MKESKNISKAKDLISQAIEYLQDEMNKNNDNYYVCDQAKLELENIQCCLL